MSRLPVHLGERRPLLHQPEEQPFRDRHGLEPRDRTGTGNCGEWVWGESVTDQGSTCAEGSDPTAEDTEADGRRHASMHAAQLPGCIKTLLLFLIRAPPSNRTSRALCPKMGLTSE